MSKEPVCVPVLEEEHGITTAYWSAILWWWNLDSQTAMQNSPERVTSNGAYKAKGHGLLNIFQKPHRLTLSYISMHEDAIPKVAGK